MKYDSLARVHFLRRRLTNMLPTKKFEYKSEEAVLEDIHVSPIALELKKQEIEKREEALIHLSTEHTLNDRRREKEPVTLKRDGTKKPGFPNPLMAMRIVMTRLLVVGFLVSLQG
eukprot:TRINITY_DN2624_c0_g1_i1.p2 TRINITY_DN2624_c0_g1~~TRINITY_DN2624_c0_g1_i1.p2  ORF type:complete len:115 (-),score=12.35 TRINITY_DN2624_c0_g1_i1:6-350(-)